MTIQPPSYELALQQYREGNAAQAYQTCILALRKWPDHVPTLSLIGKLDLKAGRLQAATEWLERAVALAPDSRVDLCNLGVAHHRLKQLDRAVEVLVRAVQADPQRADAVTNLGLALLDRGDTDKGLVCLARAAELEPSSATLQRTLGKELLRAQRTEEAITRLRRAVELDPQDTPLSLELLAALEEGSLFVEGEQLAKKVIAADPTLIAAHAALGRCVSKQHRYSEALAAFLQAVTLGMDPLQLANPMAFALVRQGRVDESIDLMDGILKRHPGRHLEHSNQVFHSAFSHRYDAEQLLQIAQGWSTHHATPLVGKRQPFSHDRSIDRRLRVGYVSPDFYGHVQRLYTLPVFRNHYHPDYEIVCYSSVKNPDSFTEEVKAQADKWYEVKQLSDADLAQKIRDDRIDVLIDLTMHMAGSRLKVFAEKPAPVQITWLAYPGTTGVDGMDYRITDPILDPPQAPLPYSEQSLWLPKTFWCYDPSGDAAQVGDLPAKAGGYVTFGCLNNFMKVNRPVLELWARVLAQVPGSRLLLLAHEGWPRTFAGEVLEANGVSCDRVQFVPQQGRDDYLATYRRIDIALDTFPYNGHTTSLDAFWMGVPVVTLVGRTIVGRAGLSLAKNLDLEQLVANDAEQFVEIAVGLASDLPRLAALRAQLRQRMQQSPMMDAPGFTRALEGLYREAWRRWCETGT